jgi:hypothetical protein
MHFGYEVNTVLMIFWPLMTVFYKLLRIFIPAFWEAPERPWT